MLFLFLKMKYPIPSVHFVFVIFQLVVCSFYSETYVSDHFFVENINFNNNHP